MIGVDSSVDIRDDSAPGHLKGVLRFRQADNLCGGLVLIGIPHCCVEIIDCTSVQQQSARKWCGDVVLPADQGDYLVPFGRHNAWHAPQNIEKGYWIDGVGSSNQEELVQRAIQAANHSATLEGANRLEKIDAGRVTYNKSILGSGLDRPQCAEKQEAPEPFGPHRSHRLFFFLGSKSFRPSESPAVSGNCNSSAVSWRAPFGSGNSSDIQ